MKNKVFQLLSSAIIITIFLNCDKSFEEINSPTPNYHNPDLAKFLVLNAIDTLQYKSKLYIIEASCGIDCMPSTDNNATRDGLLLFVKFENIDNSPLEENFNFLKQYVVNGDDVWVTNSSDENRPTGHFSSKKGPGFWHTDSLVDVYLGISLEGSNVYIVDRDVEIEKYW
jgi:hypothetical protein